MDKSWNNFFNHPEIKKELVLVNKMLNDQTKTVYPNEEDIFKVFEIPLSEIKIVILGQDPYHNSQDDIPQATGLAFSVPKNFKIPSSLKNIFNNMKTNNIISKMPKHGSLNSWASQGVFLLNTALTVVESKPNSHKKYWRKFTNKVIKYISDQRDNVSFILLGGNALSKLSLINQTKHNILVSSHPSGLSCRSKLKHYPSFYESNLFKDFTDIDFNI
jgi:uracil-DNA glycosylase